MQHFTELGLEMRSARISSDGGWFVDTFEVQEADGSQVTNPRKLDSIRRVWAELEPPSKLLFSSSAWQLDLISVSRRCWTSTTWRMV